MCCIIPGLFQCCTGIAYNYNSRTTVRERRHEGKNFAGIGVWKLLSYESQVDDGSVTYPFGKDAVGQIIYDTKGNMSAQLADMHRPSFASDNLRLSTPGEINVAFKGQSNNPSTCASSANGQRLSIGNGQSSICFYLK
jgi:hypothetical protein